MLYFIWANTERHLAINDINEGNKNIFINRGNNVFRRWLRIKLLLGITTAIWRGWIWCCNFYVYQGNVVIVKDIKLTVNSCRKLRIYIYWCILVLLSFQMVFEIRIKDKMETSVFKDCFLFIAKKYCIKIEKNVWGLPYLGFGNLARKFIIKIGVCQ